MKKLYLLLFALVALSLSAQQSRREPAEKEVSFTLSPNPASGDFVYISGGEDAPKTVRIFDLFGKAVLERRINGNALPIHMLTPGVYMVQIEQQGAVATKKLVIR
ncbi:T9SS type A sorting domain-containing protein [Robiginitalea sp. M366]|uniref:T9SS type A sorting domain-containing protein n=1 Tax=Robiginitalea aestuariiviva TaxID=3036903 RepID=UPI00240D45CC|nr:T9SS type A sorting domain-containing protein [Robiginitalea aestuariiviva]MDG1571771.1 T9SS type A sorting domain-containing protein [Robiginitalea aestuariiviva]